MALLALLCAFAVVCNMATKTETAVGWLCSKNLMGTCCGLCRPVQNRPHPAAVSCVEPALLPLQPGPSAILANQVMKSGEPASCTICVCGKELKSPGCLAWDGSQA